MGPPTNVDGELRLRDGDRVDLVASMGPPTNVDGETATRETRRCRPPSFNGAADKRRRRDGDRRGRRCVVCRLQWGRRQTSTERNMNCPDYGRGDTLASMGPPTNVDGEIPGERAEAVIEKLLQWGRRQTSTERREIAHEVLL